MARNNEGDNYRRKRKAVLKRVRKAGLTTSSLLWNPLKQTTAFCIVQEYTGRAFLGRDYRLRKKNNATGKMAKITQNKKAKTKVN